MLLSEAFAAFELDELIGENRSQKTINSYLCTRNSLLRSLGEDVPIAFLTYGYIIRWKGDMHDWDNRTSYIAQQLRNLRRVLTYLKDHGFATLEPSQIKIPKYQYRETGWYTVEEVGKLLAAINLPRDKALYAMQFCAGGRISELLSLDRDQAPAILERKRIKIRGKGRQDDSDILEFDDNALKLLEDYLDTRKDSQQPLFLSRENKRLHITTAIQNFHKYRNQAALPDRGVGATHRLRHSFGTGMDLAGVPIDAISKQMRHTKVQTTKTYIHSDEMTRRRDYDRYHIQTPLP